MAIVVTSKSAFSVAQNSTSVDQVTGTYQFVGKGKITLIAKSSATGMQVSLVTGGIALINNQAIPYTGTAGTISVNDNVILSQDINGGRIEMYLTNTTGGALTTDFIIYFDPK